jgi:hypothetical protein
VVLVDVTEPQPLGAALETVEMGLYGERHTLDDLEGLEDAVTDDEPVVVDAHRRRGRVVEQLSVDPGAHDADALTSGSIRITSMTHESTPDLAAVHVSANVLNRAGKSRSKRT